jgi:hypothetical protein
VEIIVHRGTSCHSVACGAVAYFSHARDLGAAKWLDSEIKKQEKISYLTPEIMLLSYLALKLKSFPICHPLEFFFPI